MLADKQAKRAGQIAASITLDELEQMQAEWADAASFCCSSYSRSSSPRSLMRAFLPALGLLVSEMAAKIMLNHIIVMGRLTRDPELRHTQSGTAVASFTVAVDRDFKDKETGERKTDFIDCVAWRSTRPLSSEGYRIGPPRNDSDMRGC